MIYFNSGQANCLGDIYLWFERFFVGSYLIYLSAQTCLHQLQWHQRAGDIWGKVMVVLHCQLNWIWKHPSRHPSGCIFVGISGEKERFILHVGGILLEPGVLGELKGEELSWAPSFNPLSLSRFPTVDTVWLVVSQANGNT